MKLYINFLIGLLIGGAITAAGIYSSDPIDAPSNTLANIVSVARMDVPEVPYYSQFQDIHATEWQKLGCGIADLAMLIEFYKPGTVSVDNLLNEGIAAGAYVQNAGWSHNGLARLAENYGLHGASRDFSDLSANDAFSELEKILKEGPVIASVYYKLEVGNPIPHLIVVNGISNGLVYYNDPALESGGKSISAQDFLQAWKKRLIVIRPTS